MDFKIVRFKTSNFSKIFRVTLNVACNLNLMNYPLDHQLCLIKILSCEFDESYICVCGHIDKISENDSVVFRCAHSEGSERHVVHDHANSVQSEDRAAGIQNCQH